MSNHDDKKQKGHVSDHDRTLFRKACQDVTPLKNSNQVMPLSQQSKKPTAKVPNKAHSPTSLSSDVHANSPHGYDYSAYITEKVDAETILHYSQPHLHRNLFRQMKRGTLSIEATLDLHQCTVDETAYQTDQFLSACCQKGFRWVLIIHGKGRLSKHGMPILKSFLNQWLKEQPCVLAFHSAQPKHGGSGALYVLLKSKRKE
jgi:DNA-nicking Smr family endonuclease